LMAINTMNMGEEDLGQKRGVSTGYGMRVYHEGKCNASFIGTGLS
jgi:hypothetical protein